MRTEDSDFPELTSRATPRDGGAGEIMMSHSEKVRILPLVTLIKLIVEKIIRFEK